MDKKDPVHPRPKPPLKQQQRAEALETPCSLNGSLIQKFFTRHFLYSSRKGIVICLVLCLFLLSAILLHLFFPSGRDSIHFNFCQESTIRQWQISGHDARASFSPQAGLTIQIKDTRPCRILSPFIRQDEPSGKKMEWRDYPYVRLRVDACPDDRNVIFIWNPRKNLSKSVYFRFQIPAQTRTLVLNTQQKIPWERRRPLKGPIIQFGIALKQSATIESITLLPRPALLEYVKMLATDVMTLEPFSSYSINLSYGPYLSHIPLMTCLGLIVVLLGMVCFIHRNIFTRALFAGGTMACFLLFDIYHDITLLSHAAYCHNVSAWHYDKYEEYESRFGKEFAELAEVFETTVPAGSAVLFTRERLYTVRGETNWIAFQFFPDYKSTVKQISQKPASGLNTADYIFYYYPADHVFNDKTSRVVWRKGDGKESVRVEILADLHKDVKLFRVIHD